MKNSSDLYNRVTDKPYLQSTVAKPEADRVDLYEQKTP